MHETHPEPWCASRLEVYREAETHIWYRCTKSLIYLVSVHMSVYHEAPYARRCEPPENGPSVVRSFSRFLLSQYRINPHATPAPSRERFLDTTSPAVSVTACPRAPHYFVYSNTPLYTVYPFGPLLLC